MDIAIAEAPSATGGLRPDDAPKMAIRDLAGNAQGNGAQLTFTTVGRPSAALLEADGAYPVPDRLCRLLGPSWSP